MVATQELRSADGGWDVSERNVPSKSSARGSVQSSGMYFIRIAVPGGSTALVLPPSSPTM
jgi:hypothetical protein